MLKSIAVVVIASACAVAFAAGAIAQDAPVPVASVADDGAIAPQAAAPAAAPAAAEDSWPRVIKLDAGSVTVYPPTIRSWSGTSIAGTSAIALASADGSKQTYGTMAFTADTVVNKLNRIVEITNMAITGVSLPENPAGQSALQTAFSQKTQGREIRVSLDRFEAMVPSMSVAPSVPSAPLRNDPPVIRVVETPTVLVPVQGKPVLDAFRNSRLQRVLNTPMLLMQGASGAYWLKIADGWMTAPALTGPWSVADAGTVSRIDGLSDAEAWAKGQPSINLLAPGAADADGGSADAQTASLATMAPAIVVSTTPMEILVIEGDPTWKDLGRSGLQYVDNTSGNIFRLQSSGALFVLISGRWFSASSSFEGPWSFVSPDQLPAAFMQIPHDSAKENALASIPGTPQAQEATIANSVPQMARVPVAQTMPLPAVAGGSASWQRIGGTNVDVLVNSSTPVFRTSSGMLYGVLNGVWFTAPTLNGAWKVATFVSADIYQIPPSSPYYYVTFVRVYNATPDYVLVGYTPGYFGAYTQSGVVVYGTGYVYDPWCSGTWVPVPVTYGCGASICYNPWAGWSYGFGMGMMAGWAIAGNSWCCGAYPYWGPYYGAYGAHGAYAWGPGGWAATTGNVYSHWGNTTTMNRTSAGYNAWTGNAWSTHTATAYNSATGARAAGQRGYVDNAYTGNWAEGARGAGYNPTTGNYAAGRGVEGGTANGTTYEAGRATVGNTQTGNSATVTGVKTDNGSWGAVQTDDGGAVVHDGNVYGMHDGNAYRYDGSSSSWQRYSNDGNWSSVRDEQTVNTLNEQAAARNDGDWRANNANRWQSGGEGFSGNTARTNSGGNWGGGGFSSGRYGRSGGGGGGGRGGRR